MIDRINSRFGGMNRRSFLATVAAGATVAALPRQLFAADKPTLVTSIRSLSNPYHAVWKTGAEALPLRSASITSPWFLKATVKRVLLTSRRCWPRPAATWC